MKSALQFIDQATGERATCGDVLEIEVSSAGLGWEGVLLEKGHSPHFHPVNIVTPYFYFALAIDEEFSWAAEHRGEMVDLKTQPGEIWMNPPQVPFSHSIDEPCHFIILAVDEAVLLAHFDEVLPAQKLQFLKNYNVSDQSLEFLIRLFCNEAANQGRNGIRYVHGLLRLFAFHYVRNYSDWQDLVARPAANSRLGRAELETVRLHVQQHIEEPVSIEELAVLVNCSKFHFLKEFKKAMAITPYQFIIRARLERAKELLRDGQDQIADVALRLGFSDQSHFTNSFKRQFGLTPGEFRTAKN